jgi:hypothetical protein
LDEELVFRVISGGRRRRRLRAAALTAVGLGIAALVAIPVLRSSGDAGAPAAAAGPSAASTMIEQRPGGLRWFDEQAEIYAAALRTVSSGNESADVSVHICRTIGAQPAPAGCDDGALSLDVQQQISSALAGRVRFVQDVDAAADTAASPVVVFGRLTINDNGARLAIEILCGPLCGQGQTLQLARVGGAWTVTGTTGPSWIS